MTLPDPSGSASPAATSLLFLTGPTASGKSEVALALAERWRAEIVSVDSMQVYRQLDIGTAKPSAADQARVRHHLLDVVQLDQSFDAAQFVAMANTAVREIQGRGRPAIFCGGTGLYIKAFLYGLGEAPPADSKLRAKLEQEPLDALLRELAAGDPQTYGRIDQRNPRRIRRAIEVLRLTGRPLSSQRASWSGPAPSGTASAPGGHRVFVLTRPLPQLRERIEARVNEMFARGLVAETAAVFERLIKNPTALQALGYRQVVEHLRGECSLEEAIAAVKHRTWLLARRQLTWLRHQLPVTWVDCGQEESATVIAARIEQMALS